MLRCRDIGLRLLSRRLGTTSRRFLDTFESPLPRRTHRAPSCRMGGLRLDLEHPNAVDTASDACDYPRQRPHSTWGRTRPNSRDPRRGASFCRSRVAHGNGLMGQVNE